MLSRLLLIIPNLLNVDIGATSIMILLIGNIDMALITRIMLATNILDAFVKASARFIAYKIRKKIIETQAPLENVNNNAIIDKTTEALKIIFLFFINGHKYTPITTENSR